MKICWNNRYKIVFYDLCITIRYNSKMIQNSMYYFIDIMAPLSFFSHFKRKSGLEPVFGVLNKVNSYQLIIWCIYCAVLSLYLFIIKINAAFFIWCFSPANKCYQKRFQGGWRHPPVKIRGVRGTPLCFPPP